MKKIFNLLIKEKSLNPFFMVFLYRNRGIINNNQILSSRRIEEYLDFTYSIHKSLKLKEFDLKDTLKKINTYKDLYSQKKYIKPIFQNLGEEKYTFKKRVFTMDILQEIKYIPAQPISEVQLTLTQLENSLNLIYELIKKDSIIINSKSSTYFKHHILLFLFQCNLILADTMTDEIITKEKFNDLVDKINYIQTKLILNQQDKHMLALEIQKIPKEHGLGSTYNTKIFLELIVSYMYHLELTKEDEIVGSFLFNMSEKRISNYHRKLKEMINKEKFFNNI